MLNAMDIRNGNVKAETDAFAGDNKCRENENVKHSMLNYVKPEGDLHNDDAFLSDNDEEKLDDETFSTPFEILAEFLSSLMAKDYRNAFIYCQQILQYEPNNETVQEFQPLLQEKIKSEEASSEESGEGSEENSSSKSSSSYYSSANNTEEDECSDSTSSSFSSEDEEN